MPRPGVALNGHAPPFPVADWLMSQWAEVLAPSGGRGLQGRTHPLAELGLHEDWALPGFGRWGWQEGPWGEVLSPTFHPLPSTPHPLGKFGIFALAWRGWWLLPFILPTPPYPGTPVGRQLSSWAPIPSFPPLSPADIGLFLPFPLAPPSHLQTAGGGGREVGRRREPNPNLRPHWPIALFGAQRHHPGLEKPVPVPGGLGPAG